MALLSRLNRKAEQTNETGLSTNTAMGGGRFVNKDGSPNIEVRGVHFLRRLNIYHELLNMNSLRFLAVVFIFFIFINLIFALIYLAIGLDRLNGLVANTPLERFSEAFFFSAQTFTTVGYGRINPIGFIASTVASLEALIGLLSLALATGLLYGRFTRPRSYIKFSKVALFSPFKDSVALMFRIVPYTKNYLTDVVVKITASMQIEENGIIKNQFYNLKLDIPKANTLTLNWTLVHLIDETSPFYSLSKEDIANSKAELLIFVQGFDESFSSTVVARSSYTWREFIYGAKFKPMFKPNEDNTKTILYLNKLDDYELAELPAEF